MRKFIFQTDYSLGDVVLLTAAVRDLHRLYPGQMLTDVRTGFADLWRHNPYVTGLNAYDPDVTTVPCDMPLVHRSNESACHSLHGFIEFLNRYLGTQIRLTDCRGDIHLSAREWKAPSAVAGWAGTKIPFWLVAAGGRFDSTAKWWQVERFQEVIEHFAGRIQFVQVGQAQDYHPRLDRVIDLRGRTTVRQLVNLVHHAEGVLCGVTGLMHLAAAVPTQKGRPPLRPCVVMAGGRESPTWEAYPGHQFLHTVGALPCCKTGGCWRWRAIPLGDGSALDKAEQLCLDPRNGIPRCMDMITSRDVIRSIDFYLEGGMIRPLRPAQRRSAWRAVATSAPDPSNQLPLNFLTAPSAARERIGSLPSYPGGFRGRGIIVCAGGVRLFTCAWVCISMLRRFGCRLPVELWHLGKEELDPEMRALVKPLGVQCIDALRVERQRSAPPLHGWSLKPYAILHSSFQEVLLLDADNVPVANPEFLFDAPQYRQTGAVFWPDYGRLAPDRPAWRVFDVRFRDEPEFETGQLLVNKRLCWEPLNLCLWYNENSAFYYRYVHGDKETFHMAFRRLGRSYAMPARPIEPLRGTMCQHDFHGRRLFQHRNLFKWTLATANRRVPGFLFERECRKSLRHLRQVWDGRSSRFFSGRGASVRGTGFRPRTSGEVWVAVCMSSARSRQNCRERTLARLAQTDWGQAPLLVVLDEERFRSPEEAVAHTVWRALKVCLETSAHYILCLEDNLRFNRHFRHNLSCWPLLQTGELEFASLYNPGLLETAWDLGRQATRVEGRHFYGSQAVLLSRPLAEHFVEHWFDGPVGLDMKWKTLAGQLRLPIVLHSPSLVQESQPRDGRDAFLRQAADFAPRWKSGRSCENEGVLFVAAAGAIRL